LGVQLYCQIVSLQAFKQRAARGMVLRSEQQNNSVVPYLAYTALQLHVWSGINCRSGSVVFWSAIVLSDRVFTDQDCVKSPSHKTKIVSQVQVTRPRSDCVFTRF